MRRTYAGLNERKCVSKKKRVEWFRNFEAFNMAMLAKQGWRILKEPNSLASRLLKAKYFPTMLQHRACRNLWFFESFTICQGC